MINENLIDNYKMSQKINNKR